MRIENGLAKRKMLETASRLAAVLAAVVVGGAVWAVVPAHCVALDVPAPFVLPDGTAHPAGELRICLSRNLNPVTGVHRIYLDGMPVGFILSRIVKPEIPRNSSPSALFLGASGQLRLVGYTVAANGKVFSYRLCNGRMAPGAAVAANAGGTDEAPPEPAYQVLLAARLE